MTKILFMCLGNTCRSPMAEFLMKDLVEKVGLSGQFQIESAGTYPAGGQSTCRRKTGRAWDQLRWEVLPSADQGRLRQIRSADRKGQS